MPTIETVQHWRGRTLLDRDGDRVGSIEEIYLDAQTDEPEWALVHTGLLGMRSSFVPIRDAAAEGGDVRVPFDKQQIKDAPRMDPDGELSEAEEAELYRHYGLEAGDAGPTRAGTEAGEHPAAPAVRPAPAGGDRGRARLRRYVATEPSTPAVPGVPEPAGTAGERGEGEDPGAERRRPADR
jgi:hypothetical protein